MGAGEAALHMRLSGSGRVIYLDGTPYEVLQVNAYTRSQRSFDDGAKRVLQTTHRMPQRHLRIAVEHMQ